MNKRIRQLSEARRWIVVIVMFPLIINGIYISSAFPSHAFSKEAATATLKSWKVVASPNVETSDNSLTKAAVVSANDIWAVGSYVNSTNINQTLIEHWDGSAWTVVSSPNVAASYNFLNGVAVVSAKDIWAVGYSQNTSNFISQTLTEHWNGSTWSIVSSPDVGTGYNFLNGVTVVSTNDVWAVGYYANTKTNKLQTLTEHWNGSAWSIVSSPNAGRGPNVFTGVASVSTSDIWAVGYYRNYSTRTDQTLTEHWNGSAWSVVSSPNAGLAYDHLTAVASVTASDVWAVGNHDASNATQTLIEHWDGSTWTIISSPNVGTSYNILNSIAVVSASNFWAVGNHDTTGGVSAQTLIEHWNGSAWRVVSSPSIGTSDNSLGGVAIVSASNIWAVGYYRTTTINKVQTLIEHYS